MPKRVCRRQKVDSRRASGKLLMISWVEIVKSLSLSKMQVPKSLTRAFSRRNRYDQLLAVSGSVVKALEDLPEDGEYRLRGPVSKPSCVPWSTGNVPEALQAS